ncbi:MAG: NAD(P)H-dependent oxidoreductase subunit E [Sphingobium sp.]
MVNREEIAYILVAKSAISAGPAQEMERLTQAVAARLGPSARVVHAFTEQGAPDLRRCLLEQIGKGAARIVLVPLLIPMEPGFLSWMTKVVQRWRRAHDRDGQWPAIHIAATPEETAILPSLLAAQVALPDRPVPPDGKPPRAEGSLVPTEKYRVLICHGGPCNNAGAAVIWGHFRSEQARLKLRTEGDGVMSAKTSCMGPCNLAPVIQVFPDGTWYGGVDEAGVDRIIADHLLGGRPVSDIAYAPSRTKQVLRS